jgi:pimeloyl-ACP methyl ester carboxylesterase
MFIPGFSGSHDMWNGDFRALRDRYQLVLLDTLGFGFSPKPEIDYTVDDHLDAIHTTMQALILHQFHIVGHSMGCLLALAYAFRYPNTALNLALIAFPCYQSQQEAREHIQNSSLFKRWFALNTPLARIGCLVMCHLRALLMLIASMFASDVPAVAARDALRHTWASYSRTLQHVIFQAQPHA